MQSEFRGKISHWQRPQDSGMARSPGAVRVQVLLQATIGVIDAAVQHQLRSATLQPSQRKLRQQRNWILIQLPPAHRIEVTEQAGGIVIPTPPQIASQRPESLLRGRDEA